MKDFFRNNGILILIIAILLTAIFAVCSAILGMSPITNLLGVLASPFRAGANAIAAWTEDQYSYAFRYQELLEENELLRAQLAELQDQILAAQDSNRQNELLRSLLGLAEQKPDLEFQEASVTTRAVSNWNFTLTVNQGSAHGVKEGACVVDQYGNLVGIVSKVGLNWAEVATIVDPSIEVGARLPRTDDEAVLEGDFSLMLQRRVKLSYLPENTLPISGDRITTSGLGGRYPADLLIGTVESIHTEVNGLTQYAVIAPAADLEHVRYVFVIKGFDAVE